METTTNSVLPNATSFSVTINVPKDELVKQFEQFWGQVKDRLSPDIVTKAKKGGYRSLKRERVERAAGGKSEFYRPILIDYVSSYLDKQEKQAISYNDIVLSEGGDTGTIKANVYLEPAITWKQKPGIDSQLVVRIDKLPENFAQKLVSDDLERSRQAAATLSEEPAETAAQMGSIITLDCTTKVDGNVWEPGTFKNNRWAVDPSVFRVQGIAEQLVGLKAGDTKTFTVTYPADVDVVGGKQAEVTVSVLKVLKRNVPELNDQFAVSNGLESLDKWSSLLLSKYTAMIEEERNEAIISRLVAQIVTTDVVDVEPIPVVWIVQKARQVYAWQRENFKTEDELIQAYSQAKLKDGTPVTDRNTLLWFFGESAANELIQDLVLRSWGKLKGVEGDSRLSQLESYTDAVRDYLLKSAVVEEVEPKKE
jgi:FKBP-type peptidyl-prolyl cis-trans isomerase (trigger factor)